MISVLLPLSDVQGRLRSCLERKTWMCCFVYSEVSQRRHSLLTALAPKGEEGFEELKKCQEAGGHQAPWWSSRSAMFSHFKVFDL